MSRQTSPSSADPKLALRADGEGGFTLLEVLVVVSLLALTATLAISSLRPNTEKEAPSLAVAALQAAQLEAMRTGAARSLSVESEVAAIPLPSALVLCVPSRQSDQGATTVTFLASGAVLVPQDSRAFAGACAGAEPSP